MAIPVACAATGADTAGAADSIASAATTLESMGAVQPVMASVRRGRGWAFRIILHASSRFLVNRTVWPIETDRE